MVCFWALFLIFVATVAFLGDLAVTRNAGQSEPNPGNEGHTFFGILLAAAAIVVVIAVIARHHRIENSDDRYHR